MPPPKARLHKSTGRLKNISNYNSSTASNSENRVNTNNTIISNQSNNQNSGNILNDLPTASTNQTDSTAIEQFELELYWCIQTLDSSLHSGKLTSKQAQDADKTLRLLKSHNQPMVKKRQLMQSTFGDYRKKMADEEKKLRGGNTSIQFVNGTDKETNNSNKGHFVKKSLTSTLGQPNFQFNFPIDAMENLSIQKTTQRDENSPNSTATEIQGISDTKDQQTTELNRLIKPKHFTSDNSFKFNFTINCE